MERKVDALQTNYKIYQFNVTMSPHDLIRLTTISCRRGIRATRCVRPTVFYTKVDLKLFVPQENNFRIGKENKKAVLSQRCPRDAPWHFDRFAQSDDTHMVCCYRKSICTI